MHLYPDPSELRFAAVVVSGLPEVHTAIDNALGDAKVTTIHHPAWPAVVDLARRDHIPVVIVGPDVEWRELVSALDGEDAKPSVIVLMHAADSRLWAEIMSAGVFDAMTVSVDRERLQWTLAAAYRRWGRKQLVRQAIAANPMVQEA